MPSTNLFDTEWLPTQQQWRAKVSWWTVFKLQTSRTVQRELWKEHTRYCVFMCYESYIGFLGEIFFLLITSKLYRLAWLNVSYL